jgi:predicted nucleic acid-binding protein
MTESTGSIERKMVDTNVLIYAIDVDSGDKHQSATGLMRRLISENTLTLSLQALNEFYAVATRPHKPPSLFHERANQAVKELAATAMVLPLTAAITLRAIEAMPRHGLSFWDA